MSEPKHDSHALLMLQFLRWIGPAGRSHAETMEAWRSSCPRLSIWEDALDAGLVRVDPAAGVAEAELRVRLTAHAEALLATEAAAS